MNREEFLTGLGKRLSGLPQEDIDERLSFYEEMIVDRMEDGITEEEAVAEIGSVDSVIEQIMSETPLAKLVKEKVKPKRNLRAWEIVLLVIGSPVWIPLALAAVIVVIAIYIVIWTAVICVYVADLSMMVGIISGVISIMLYCGAGNFAGIFFAIGMVLACGGGAILLFFASKWITKAILKLSKRILLGIKSSLVGREA
ncbi:MAG: DUF1700 domain-containing protein [Lachnospiraceae bacterium]|nr:DUF1700 domain-containing protein [Lachnospiraceae bacterium]